MEEKRPLLEETRVDVRGGHDDPQLKLTKNDLEKLSEGFYGCP